MTPCAAHRSLTEQGFDSSVPTPGRRQLGDSINARLMDAILRHRHFLLRAENGVVKDTVEALREARSSIVGALGEAAADAGVDDVGGFRQRRLRTIQRRIEAMLGSTRTDTVTALREGLERVIEKEMEVQANLLRRNLPEPVAVDLVGPDIDRVRQLAEQPIGGQVWTERVGANFQEMGEQINRSLTTSFTTGEGIGAAQRRLRQHVEQLGIQRATLIARTEIQRAANDSALALYERNRDVIKGVQWVSTLDSRTCLICASLDGQTWRIGESHPRPVTGSHPACRCFMSPVTRSWEELGIDREEFPPSTRASMDGQVPGSVDYRSWLDGQSEDFQREVLGASRFERFRDGDLELDQMVRDQRVLNVDELPDQTLEEAA